MNQVEEQKQFRYTCTATGSRDKIGALHSFDAPPLQFSAPIEFGGPGGDWTPESLFIGAITSCYWLTFLGLAKKRRLEVTGFSCRAEGTLEKDGNGYRFVHVQLYPAISIPANVDPQQARRIAELAEKSCLIARSVVASIEAFPSVVVEPVEGWRETAAQSEY